MSIQSPVLVVLLALVATALAPTTAAAANRTKLKKLDVSSLSVEVAGGICAGQDSKLAVVAHLGDGTSLRTFEADGSAGGLRPKEFDLKVDLGEVSGPNVLFVENTGESLLDRSVKVDVSAKGSPLTATASISVGFACEIALDYSGDGKPGTPWIPPRSERDIAEIEAHRAATGKMGPRFKDIARAALPVGYAMDNIKNAKPALKGNNGAKGANGGPGLDGAVGGPGSAGQPGVPGRNLTVDVKQVSTAGGQPLSLVKIAMEGGSERSVLVDSTAGGHLLLVARGGVGGKGGKGGTGGSGGAGTYDVNQGRGGNGAAGGPGGPGGRGGDGGSIQVRYDGKIPSLAQVVQADVAGGKGGSGGAGGEFGASGSGAEGASSGDMGSTDSASGSYGPDGSAGNFVTVPQ